MMWLRKKNEDYTIYEADEYYADGYETEDDNFLDTDNKSFWNSTIIILFITGYILFLVIGIFSTTFTSNPFTGIKEAQIITVQMREERKSYMLLKEQYLIIRDLLQRTQEIDAELQNAKADQLFVYATKYESLLPFIDRNIPKAKGLAIDSKYKTLLDQIVNIYVNDLSIYLQKMGSALARQDKTIFSEAMSWRQKTIEDFEQLQENMKSFMRMVKLEDKDLEQPAPLLPFVSSDKEN